MKRLFLYIITVASILVSQDNKLEDYHITLKLHENLINDFFANMGDIEGKGKATIASYKWKLIKPRIDIEEDTILFSSKIKLSVGELKTHKDVRGWVSAHYNQETNKIQLKIEEAKVILDIDLFGNNVVLTELDIAHYFSKSFNLNGPNPMSEHIEFNLPNGEVRQIKVATNQSYMLLEKDAIIIKTALDFKE
ncbi:MAG: hypothetical protein CMG66_04405 [Candidatus Marinimicrobia bacterium]|nr:hypothetical protein [Candidatus Neomarinimicrobiota bacterium]|tara:strand:- start:34756 stop:35334 length:579 start_codon:yes stop_codon:yes gene_type:complete